MATKEGWRPYILPVLILTTMKVNYHMYIIFYINFHLIKNIVTALCINMSLDSI